MVAILLAIDQIRRIRFHIYIKLNFKLEGKEERKEGGIEVY